MVLHRVAVVGFACVSLLLLPACDWIATVSGDFDGNRAEGRSPSLSENARYVAFNSPAALVSSDTNGNSDIYRRDLRTGAMVWLGSVVPDVNREDTSPSINSDGRYIAFASQRIGADAADVFRYDISTGTLVQLNLTETGSTLGPLAVAPSISADGSRVAFTVEHPDPNVTSHAYVRDVGTGTTMPVTSPLPGNERAAVISGNGRYVAFGFRRNLEFETPDDNTYVKDLESGTTSIVSVDRNGAPTGDERFRPAISTSGRYIVFGSSKANVAVGGNAAGANFFERDMQTGSNRLVTVGIDGQPPDGNSFHPTVSGDGRFVGVESWASNLVANDHNETKDVFVRDMTEAVTMRASVGAAGEERFGLGGEAALSPSGRFIAFSAGEGGASTYGVYVRTVLSPRIGSVTPSLLARGTTTTLVVAGDGFAAGTVASSSGGVHVDSTTFVSEHALRVAVHVDPQTALGPRTLAVSIPAPGPGDYGIASSVTNCECLVVTQ